MATSSVDQILTVVSEPSSTAWDAFVLQHSQGHLLQYSAWGVLKSRFGWRSQRVAILGLAPEAARNSTSKRLDDANHTILAGAQVLFRERYGVSVAYISRGPLFCGDPAVDDLLLEALARIARRRRAIFLRLEPNMLAGDAQADQYHTWLLMHGFQLSDPIQPRSTLHLDLAPPPERLFASFSKGHRADIRKAERLGVVIRTGSDADIAAFYAIMQATSARANFGIHTEAYYRAAWQLFQPRSKLLLAEQDGQVVAAHLVFADSHAGLYLYSGASDVGLKAGANHLLQWHAIQWAREQDCETYDLWGIPDALGRAAVAPDEAARTALETEAQADPLIGVYRFKKGFGGTTARYLPAYDQVYLAPLYALWRRRLA
ncbi:MAG: peptidoglycan bridge formation glycyltransferase FemA/FemB family protein [Chloroflexales bacterium]|nr:peptidoglycan bridge formation glycyltransferase FemA/FemB family protein [Chloroflexales bacterium]